MKIFRAFAGVIVGYLIFAFSSMMLVGMVMERSGPVVMGLGLIAAATVANLAMQLGAEPTWYKVGTLLLTVPAILSPGYRLSPRGRAFWRKVK